MRTGGKNLSKREIRLLMIALSVALLSVMVIYVHIPLFDRLNARNAEFSDLMQDRAHIDAVLASEATTRDNYSAVIDRYNSISPDFLMQSPNSEIGRMLTDLCLSHGLQPIAQQLSAPADLVIQESVADAEKTTGSSTPESNSDLSGTRDGGTDDNLAGKDRIKAKTVFSIVSASMSVSGNYDDLKELMDTAEQIGYIRISRVSFERDSDDPDSIIDRITINFQVTMLKER